MSIPTEAYQALAHIVGDENVSDDPLICSVYGTRAWTYESELDYSLTLTHDPACVVIPKTTEQIQRIVKVCNRYKIPFVPNSTFWYSSNQPFTENSVTIDLKTMNYFEIDDKQMYAVMEAGVTLSMLQEQAMKRGLYTVIGGGGAQCSALAQHITAGVSPLSYRGSVANHRILATEWVLPDGEMMRIGSLSLSDDWFWGEGPGPDLRGLIKGFPGWLGGLGICTRIAVKLLPFQPERLVPTGISPDTTLQLPTNRMRWYNFTLPDRDVLFEAMYEVARSEIGAALIKVPIFFRVIARSKSKADFWERWSKITEEEMAQTHIVRVLLIGYTSEKQLEWEERVLMDIMNDFGGIQRPTLHTDESWFKNADSAGMWWMTGHYVSVEYTQETVEHNRKLGEAVSILEKDYEPPFMPEYGEPGWFQILDFGHGGSWEYLVYLDPDDKEGMRKLNEFYLRVRTDIEIPGGFWTAFMGGLQPTLLTGPAYGPNYHHFADRLKETFDPQNVSHPPVPRTWDAYMDKAPEWMKSLKTW